MRIADKPKTVLSPAIKVALVCSILWGAIGIAIGIGLAPKPIETTSVHNLLVDVNSDGYVDLIVNGEVIYYLPPTPPAQP